MIGGFSKRHMGYVLIGGVGVRSKNYFDGKVKSNIAILHFLTVITDITAVSSKKNFTENRCELFSTTNHILSQTSQCGASRNTAKWC